MNDLTNQVATVIGGSAAHAKRYLPQVLDPFNTSTSLFNTFSGKLLLVVAAASVLVIIVYALVYIFGGEDAARKSKKQWGKVGIGIVISFSASALAAFIQQQAQNSQ
ncbi:hypothetical protein [Furfurilactobacillus entadae]|uniref:hypothetical protein n=1 Tax=Furfurilactobacillus entadae TaxID=2922307 RepID=UPI0035EFCBD3